MIGATTRSIFFVYVAAGTQPTALNNNLPLNQTLADVLNLVLALQERFEPSEEHPPAADFLLFDIYQQPLDTRMLVQQIPFPGCVIAVSRNVRMSRGSQTVEGEAAVLAAVKMVSMTLFAGRENAEDAVMRRYLKFLASGLWRFEPTPFADDDLSLVHHAADAKVAAELRRQLEAKGLRVRVRGISPRGESVPAQERSMAEGVRALAVLVSQRHRDEPWMAYDVGAAWAAGIPVVPIAVGRWTVELPDLLGPYQRVAWSGNGEAATTELLKLLHLEPWHIPVKKAARKSAKPRKKGA